VNTADHPTITDLCCHEFDAFSEAARGWDLDFRQLDRGPFRGELLQAEAGPVLLTRVRFNRRFEQRGRALPDRRTFAVLAQGAGPVLWCRKEFKQDAVACFRGDGEFEAVSVPGFEVYTLSIDKKRLEDLAQQLGCGEPGPGEGRLVPSHPEKETVLRQRLRRICVASETRTRSRDGPWLRKELVDGLPRAILLALPAVQETPSRSSTRLRARARETARAYIEASKGERLTVGDLCRATGASERTLEYAFREHFGVTPKAYLQAVRLHQVRKELRVSDPSLTRVADVANRWGFWHMGQFAADYRRFFGELPSETLRRSR
jgi:AraC family ethanolamine operon transcriptional activator